MRDELSYAALAEQLNRLDGYDQIYRTGRLHVISIQQAGMGAISPPELATAVSEAGGAPDGGQGPAGVTVVILGRMLDWMQEHTRRPYGVNFVILEQWGPGIVRASNSRPVGMNIRQAALDVLLRLDGALSMAPKGKPYGDDVRVHV